jgi:uncharacterized repeat protein (TIGR02543 family)
MLTATLVGLAPLTAVGQGKQRAAETLTVSFTTATTLSPEFAPRNVLVVWVEDSSGAFVKTIGRWAGERYYDLVNWTGKAGYDTDAVTGATRRNHTGTAQVTWDMTNKAGQAMPDGTYRIRLELADRDRPNASSNNVGTFTFTKNGTTSVQSTSGGRFSNVNITYSGRTVTYTLAVTAGAGGQIVQPATSPGTHLANAVVTIQATPSAGYVFTGWTGSANIAAAGNALTTVQMLGNTTITANFTDLDEQFAVSAIARTVPEGGSAGITVALTAQPTGTVTANVDYVSGDTNISGATRAQLQFTTTTWNTPQTVILSAAEDADAANGVASFQLADAAASLTPVGLTFTEADDDHVLTLAVNPPEAGTVDPPGATVQEGAPAAVVPIAATPGVGWQFVEWTGDLQQAANPQAASTTVTMGAAYSLTASFARIPCTLTVSAGTGGSVDAPTEAVAVHDYGTTVNLVATPDPHKGFDRWVSSPGSAANEFASSTTITLTADTTAQATFKDVDTDDDQLPDAWEAGHFTDLTAQDGAGNPDLDSLTNLEEYALGSDPTKTTLVVTAGWNLLTVPRSPALGVTHADQLLGLSYVSVWGWDGTQSRYYDLTRMPAGEDVLKPLEGYWVFVSADGWTDVAGAEFPAGDRNLTTGWNLVGPLVGGAFAPPAAVSQLFWRWDGIGYISAVELYPTSGYWMYSSQPTAVTLP